MTSYRSRGGSSKSGYSSKSSSTSRTVSPARLSQKSGSSNAFGGVTKVNHNNGTFSMRKTGK
jgi:hypothetical protein